MSSYFQPQQQQNNRPAADNSMLASQSGTFYSSPWLKTSHTFPKCKEGVPDLETQCTSCGKSMRELLDAIPCKTRELQDAEREIRELRRQLASSQGQGVPYNSAAATGKSSAVRGREPSMPSN